MARPVNQRPAILSSDRKFIQAIPEGDYISGQYLDLWSPALTIMTEVLVQQLGNNVIGRTYTEDYPYRHQITTHKFINHPKVDNLVQSPVEIVPGTWKLSYVVDEADQDSGVYPAYVYEIAQSAVTNHRLAIDYFRTVTQRNGTVTYRYEGTAYFAAASDTRNFRLFSQTKEVGFGAVVSNADPENPSPEDIVSSALYVVPRKLKAGEQVQNLITTTDNWVKGTDYHAAIRKSPLLL